MINKRKKSSQHHYPEKCKLKTQRDTTTHPKVQLKLMTDNTKSKRRCRTRTLTNLCVKRNNHFRKMSSNFLQN